MAKVRRIGRIWLVATAVSLSAAMVQPAAGAPTVKGDAAAWAEVETALKKAQGVAHREKTTTSGGSTTIVEFVPPDSRHFIEQHPGGRSEGFAVGDKTWMHMRWIGMSDAPKCPSDQIRWAVITKMGRVLSRPTADAARGRVERRGYFVLEVNRDHSSQAVSF
jgi:hypothetical protein